MKKQRVYCFDTHNVVACFSAVSVHLNGFAHSYSNSFDWRQALFVDCLFY